MIDTHCHLGFDCYDDRREAVLADARAAGVRGFITVSTTTGDCERNLAIAANHPDVWCTAGVHPLHSDEPIDWEQMIAVGRNPKCIAWGELGLDNHYKHPPRETQRRVLEAQLDLLARCAQDGLTKPIVVHCRDAFDDVLAVFRDAPFDPSRYVFHCFTGTPDDARKVLHFGAWISFTGVVTFRNAPEVAKAARLVPDERIMVETDAPFLTPEPHRKVRPNEPKYVVDTARFLARDRGADFAAFERVLDANAERFFGIALPPATNPA